MIYKEALSQIEKSKVKLGFRYTVPTHGDGFVFTSYELIDITISSISELNKIQSEINRNLTNETALKKLGLFESSDLEVTLTFWYDSYPPVIMTLAKYIEYQSHSTP